MKSSEIQEGLYTKREISPDFTLFWRILTELNEIEVVMRTKGTGYAAIGWRPKNADKSCKRIPLIKDKEARSVYLDPEVSLNTVPEPDGKSNILNLFRFCLWSF